jgi:hypothetical protein
MSSDVSDKIAAPNGGYRATAVTSDRHAARLVFQKVSFLPTLRGRWISYDGDEPAYRLVRM